MRGIGTSPGIALGKVFVYKEPEINVMKENIENIEKEINRLDLAIEEGTKQVDKLYEKTLHNVGKEEAEIFNAHKMILKDPEFIGSIKEKVKSEKVNVEWAIKTISDEYIQIFENMEDEYLKERALDLKDISTRLLRILLGIEATDLGSIEEESIILAYDLTPSDTAQIDKKLVLGFVTEIGGPTSHSAIMARTMEIPSVSGIKNVINIAKNGDFIIIDGKSGEILLNPSKEEIKYYSNKQKK